VKRSRWPPDASWPSGWTLRQFPGAPEASLEARYWYAPAVKNKVKQTVVSGPLQTELVGYELESFTIDTGKPATP